MEEKLFIDKFYASQPYGYGASYLGCKQIAKQR